MELSGKTKPFAVLGHPVAHTLSPAMHNAAIAGLGMDAAYLAFDVAPDELMQVLPAMAAMGFGGVNLTVPLKEVAFNGLSDLDKSARMLGAVNTVEMLDGSLRGHNTDGAGFITSIEEAFHTSVTDLTVLVLGAGGAGRAVALTCADQGAASVLLADIDTARAEKVATEIAALAANCNTEILPALPSSWPGAASRADLVVQATPVGMNPSDKSLLPASAFRKGQIALDMIYMFPDTDFMRSATSGGAKAINGLGMLLHQGARAFEIWTGKQPPTDAMRTALETAVYDRES